MSTRHHFKPDENVLPEERTKCLEIFDDNDNNRIGHMASLDTTGAVVISHRTLDPGTVMPLRIAWDRDGGWTETAKLSGEVIQSQPDLASDTYTIEIRFVQPNAQAIAEIQRIIKQEPDFASNRQAG